MLPCGILKKEKEKDTNKPICKTETVTDVQNKFMATKGEKRGKKDTLGDWSDIYTPLYIKKLK